MKKSGKLLVLICVFVAALVTLIVIQLWQISRQYENSALMNYENNIGVFLGLLTAASIYAMFVARRVED